MKKLIIIEWKKISGHRFFWIGTGLYLFCMILLITKFGSLKVTGNQNEAVAAFKTFGEAGFYKLPYIWHNITYIGAFFKYIPAFIIIFFFASEFQNKTMRQNIIDGLSIGQYYSSKILGILFFTFLSILVIVFTGFIAASTHNPQAGIADYFKGMDYLLAFGMELLFFFCLCVFANVLFRKSAITIVIIVVYLVIESITSLIIGKPYSDYLPSRPSSLLITQPFTRMFQVENFLGLESVERVPLRFLLLSLLYTTAFAFGGYFFLKKRDVT